MQPVASASLLTLGPLALDRTAHELRVRGALVPLTRLEFELLAALLSQPGRVWSRAQLLERVRGTDFAGYERNMDGHIKNLRRKLREPLAGRDPIRSVYGVGYGLEADVLSS